MSERKIGVGFGVIIIKDGNVLLGQRHKDKDKADSELRGEGTWTMPGGKLEYGESFEQGAIREVKEETGIDIQDVEVIAVNNDQNEHAHFITIGLLAKGFFGEPQVMEPEEIVRWGWFPIDDLPKPLFFPSEKLLWNYCEKKFYIKD